MRVMASGNVVQPVQIVERPTDAVLVLSADHFTQEQVLMLDECLRTY